MTKIWVLLFICLPVFSTITIIGQTGTLTKYKRFEKESIFINKIDKNGNIFCKEVKEDVSLLTEITSSIDLHILPSMNNHQTLTGLKIILRGTDQLMQYPEAVSAFIRAAARWERVISTPITTVLDVDFGPTRFGAGFGEGVLGATATTTYYALKSDATNALVPDIVQRLIDLKPGDKQLQNLYNAIPVPTPSTVPSNLERAIGTLINLQALGFIEEDISSDPAINRFGSVPSIGFNSSFSFDLDPSDGISVGTHDFDATCAHEIGHALGFVTAAGFSDHKGLADLYYPWDLFRVRPDAVESGSLLGFSTAPRVTTAGPTYSSLWSTEDSITYYFSNHIFFDGLEKVELSTATGERLNGDGQQSSHWRDDALRPPSLDANRWIGIMDPTLASGTRLQINYHDLRVLEVIGYTINYDYKYANMLLMHGQDTLNLAKKLDTLKFVDVSLNSQRQIQYQLINLSLDNPLQYEFEITFLQVIPLSAPLHVDVKPGSVKVGGSELVTISFLTKSVPASFFGTIRMKTNDLNNPIIDIPFELTTGGVIAPKINFSISSLGDFSFTSDGDARVKTKEFTVRNLGNQPLSYMIYISLSTKSHQSTSLVKSTQKSSNIEQFYKVNSPSGSYTYYSTDFEDPNNKFGGFKQVANNKDEWQQTIVGPAIYKGHSKPTVIHFGNEVNGELNYDNFTTGFFYSPEFYNWNKIDMEDVTCVSFKYFNKSELGGDVVTFLGSKDSKRTWHELTSSKKGGMIKSHSTEWETVLFRFPDFSNILFGNYWTNFAFQFSSNESVVDQGFFLDDFEITILQGLNPIYVDNDWAYLPTLNSSEDVLFVVDGALLAPGQYDGNLIIESTDTKNPTVNIPFSVNNIKLSKAVKGTLYASTESGSSGDVLKIDPNTGKGFDLGSSGFTTLKSITINPKTDELFGFTYSPSNTEIIKVDGKNGLGIHQYKTSVPLSAMAFTPSGDLLGIATPPPSSKFEVPAQRLYKINITNGDAQSLATLQVKAAAMAIEPSTGYIWISVDTTKDKDKIYKFNPATGDTTLVGRTGIGNNTMRALAFDNHGNLWGTYEDDKFVSTLIKIDKTTGVSTTVGRTDYKGITGLAFASDSVTDVTTEQLSPTSFALFNNYPNPFNPSTVISYQIPENSFVILKVYDVLGKEVSTLVNEYQTAGIKNVTLDLMEKELGSGIYFYQLKAGNFNQTKKMLLLK
ncbi:MAG: NF038122 family metalloprotease [Ignavibacteriaceae bacterium]|nr:NF038122 family metalloprotease [Ignavibacteriaceae bacterium]